MATVITATLAELLIAEPALARLSEERVPVKTAYHVAKLAKAVRTELAFFHEERNAAIKALGGLRPATAHELAQGMEKDVMAVLPENLPAFMARVQELGAFEVTVHALPVTLDMLDGLTLAPSELLNLGPLLQDEQHEVSSASNSLPCHTK